jgi:hypothetical protein
MRWKPSKKEIQDWLSKKEDEFMHDERPRTCRSTSNVGNKGTSIQIYMKFSLLSFLVYCMSG